ncbi:MAG: LUD domain-containing protein [Verrucomicrobiota bacterium]
MSSRDAILAAVRSAQPKALSLFDVAAFGVGGRMEGSLTHFIAMLDFIGARVVRAPRLEDAATWLRENIPVSAAIASTVPGLPGTVDLAAITDPHDLDGVHTAVFPARFGVCENGAVWIEETDLGHRVLPMIAEHLLIVIRADQIVADMHAAYQRVGKIGSGFGLFLAGPSKTADIEQCLVIGAHGARGATIFIWGE